MSGATLATKDAVDPLIHKGYLTELADHLRAEGRNRFLLTAPPLRLPGAVGSPATPVATV